MNKPTDERALSIEQAVNLIENYALSRQACMGQNKSLITQSMIRLVGIARPLAAVPYGPATINLDYILDLAAQAEQLTKTVESQDIPGLSYQLTELMQAVRSCQNMVVAFREKLTAAYTAQENNVSMSMDYMVKGEENART